MATVTGSNVLEWKMRELARRAGKKYEPDAPKSIYDGMSAKELKEHKDMLSAAMKDSEEN